MQGLHLKKPRALLMEIQQGKNKNRKGGGRTQLDELFTFQNQKKGGKKKKNMK